MMRPTIVRAMRADVPGRPHAAERPWRALALARRHGVDRFEPGNGRPVDPVLPRGDGAP